MLDQPAETLRSVRGWLVEASWKRQQEKERAK